jgi:hypothetical protein
MLKIWDANNFRRTLAGLCIIMSPLLQLIAFTIVPDLPEDSGAFLAAVAANRTTHLATLALFLLSAILLVSALAGLVHILRHRGVVLGHIGAGFLLLGIFGRVGLVFVLFVALEMASPEANRGEMIALWDRIDVGIYPVLSVMLMAFYMGAILLFVGLYRARVAPLWAMLAIVATTLLVILATSKILVSPAMALFALALGWIGWRVLAMSDEDWERVPEQGEVQRQPATV